MSYGLSSYGVAQYGQLSFEFYDKVGGLLRYSDNEHDTGLIRASSNTPISVVRTYDPTPLVLFDRQSLAFNWRAVRSTPPPNLMALSRSREHPLPLQLGRTDDAIELMMLMRTDQDFTRE